jgi:hypothetical protein
MSLPDAVSMHMAFEGGSTPTPYDASDSYGSHDTPFRSKILPEETTVPS